MIRLGNPDISRINEELSRYHRAMGYAEPLPVYRRGHGQQVFAVEDLVNSILLILGAPAGNNLPANPISLERVEAVEEPGGGRTEPMRDDKQSTDASSLTPVFDGSNGR